MFTVVDKTLADEEYYHGLLPREDIKMMLKCNGDFIVRITEPVAGQPRAFVISVMVHEEDEERGVIFKNSVVYFFSVIKILFIFSQLAIISCESSIFNSDF